MPFLLFNLCNLTTEPIYNIFFFFLITFIQSPLCLLSPNLNLTEALFCGLRDLALPCPHYLENNDDTASILIPLKGLKAAM